MKATDRAPFRRLTAMAYHKAAHAVVAWRQGRTIQRAAIAADLKEGLRPCWDVPTLRNALADEAPSALIATNLSGLVVVLLAGAEAERLVGRRYDWTAARLDLERAVDLALYVGGDLEGATAWLKWPRLQARRFVNANRVPIKALAERLLERRMLSGSEMERMLREADRVAG